MKEKLQTVGAWLDHARAGARKARPYVPEVQHVR